MPRAATNINGIFWLSVLVALLLWGFLSRVAPRPTETQIKQSDYGQCIQDFSPCKGKFIKFSGIVKSVDGSSVRIANEVHGFDVFGMHADSQLVGSRVIFSGFLAESHLFNDDVVRGKIESVLMNAARVQAEKKAYDDTHPTCSKSWRACKDNLDLIENNSAWMFHGKGACMTAAEDTARYSKPKWSWVPFGKYLPVNVYRKDGKVHDIDEDVGLQNAFGIYGRSRVVCVYDMNAERVLDLSVNLP